MKIYGLKNCDTCRKALKALQAAGHDAELVDVREHPLSPEVLAEFYAEFGEGLVNTRSTTWRGLDDAERLTPPSELLAKYPALMKRPVIEQGEKRSLGWTKDVQQQWNV